MIFVCLLAKLTSCRTMEVAVSVLDHPFCGTNYPVVCSRLIENEYLGLKNGILDQSAILLSQRHSLTAIHCEVLRTYFRFYLFPASVFCYINPITL